MNQPQRYRKKPVEIEAIQWTGDNSHAVGLFLGQADRNEANQFTIPTPEGVMRADVGDWIIKGVAGEFYPCKPEIFAATYTPASVYTLEAESSLDIMVGFTLTWGQARALQRVADWAMNEQTDALLGNYADGSPDQLLADRLLLAARSAAAAIGYVLDNCLKENQ